MVLANQQFIELMISVGIPVGMLCIGLIIGKMNETMHLSSLKRREQDLMDGMLVTDIRTFDGSVDPARHAEIVMAEAVIANDYLKSFLAALRKLLGGELGSYRSLMMRARREAIVRLAAKARDKGHNALCNLRFETADIGGMAKKGAVMVVVVASATAYSTLPGGSQ